MDVPGTPGSEPLTDRVCLGMLIPIPVGLSGRRFTIPRVFYGFAPGAPSPGFLLCSTSRLYWEQHQPSSPSPWLMFARSWGSQSTSWAPPEHPCPGVQSQPRAHDGQAEALGSWAALSWEKDFPGSSLRAAAGLALRCPPCRPAPCWGAEPVPRGAAGSGAVWDVGHGPSTPQWAGFHVPKAQ